MPWEMALHVPLELAGVRTFALRAAAPENGATGGVTAPAMTVGTGMTTDGVLPPPPPPPPHAANSNTDKTATQFPFANIAPLLSIPVAVNWKYHPHCFIEP
jgi:hypothetical protein